MNELRILNGTKKGTSLYLDGEPVKIGSSLQSELVLTDDGIEPEHVEIGILNDSDTNLRPISGRITTISGTHTHQLLRLRNGIPFKLGDIWLVIQDVDKSWPARMPKLLDNTPSPQTKPSMKEMLLDWSHLKEVLLKRLASYKYIFRISILGLVFIGVRTLANAPSDELNIEPQKLLLSNEQSLVDEVVAKKAEESPSLIKQAITIVKKMLRERDLTNVSVNSSQGNIYLKGNISRDDKRILERMLLRYQNDHTDLPNLVDKSEELIVELPFSIVSVVSGPFGHVVTKDGERLSRGQEKQGYTLIEIEKGWLVFKGKQEVKLSW